MKTFWILIATAVIARARVIENAPPEPVSEPTDKPTHESIDKPIHMPTNESFDEPIDEPKTIQDTKEHPSNDELAEIDAMMDQIERKFHALTLQDKNNKDVVEPVESEFACIANYEPVSALF